MIIRLTAIRNYNDEKINRLIPEAFATYEETFDENKTKINQFFKRKTHIDQFSIILVITIP